MVFCASAQSVLMTCPLTDTVVQLEVRLHWYYVPFLLPAATK